jgi:hypothetical protein
MISMTTRKLKGEASSVLMRIDLQFNEYDVPRPETGNNFSKRHPSTLRFKHQLSIEELQQLQSDPRIDKLGIS